MPGELFFYDQYARIPNIPKIIKFDNKISIQEQFYHFPFWLLFVASKALEAWCEAQICVNERFWVFCHSFEKNNGKIFGPISRINVCIQNISSVLCVKPTNCIVIFSLLQPNIFNKQSFSSSFLQVIQSNLELRNC